VGLKRERLSVSEAESSAEDIHSLGSHLDLQALVQILTKPARLPRCATSPRTFSEVCDRCEASANQRANTSSSSSSIIIIIIIITDTTLPPTTTTTRVTTATATATTVTVGPVVVTGLHHQERTEQTLTGASVGGIARLPHQSALRLSRHQALMMTTPPRWVWTRTAWSPSLRLLESQSSDF
jgi:hypothetical protein